jgi:hypothetical protein
MMTLRNPLLLLLLVLSWPSIAGQPDSGHAFSSGAIVLLQPDAEMSERLGGDAGSLAVYIEELFATSAAVVNAYPVESGTTAVLVVALRPGGKSRVWLEFGDNVRPIELSAELRRRLEAVRPPLVWGGPISFLINVQLWGGGRPLTSSESPVFVPIEWRQAAERAGRPLDTEAILDAIWPDEG